MWWIPAILAAFGILGFIFFLFVGRESKISRPHNKKNESEELPEKKKGKVSRYWHDFKEWSGKRRRWLAPAFLLLGIFSGFWLAKELEDSSHLNPGMMTYDNTQIVVSKLPKDGDMSLLPHYQTPGEGEPLRFGTKGVSPEDIELYVVVFEKNDQGELVPSTSHEPVRYSGQTLSKCTVKNYALFLGKNSKVRQTTIVAEVTAGVTCSELSGKLVNVTD